MTGAVVVFGSTGTTLTPDKAREPATDRLWRSRIEASVRRSREGTWADLAAVRCEGINARSCRSNSLAAVTGLRGVEGKSMFRISRMHSGGLTRKFRRGAVLTAAGGGLPGGMHPGVLPRVGQPGRLRGGLREEPRPALAARPVLDRAARPVAVRRPLRPRIPAGPARRPGRRGPLAGAPVARQPADRARSRGPATSTCWRTGSASGTRRGRTARSTPDLRGARQPGRGRNAAAVHTRRRRPRPPDGPSAVRRPAVPSAPPGTHLRRHRVRPGDAAEPTGHRAVGAPPAGSGTPGPGRGDRRRGPVGPKFRHEFRDRTLQRFVADTPSQTRAPGDAAAIPPPRPASSFKPAGIQSLPEGQGRVGAAAGPAGGAVPRIPPRAGASPQPRTQRPAGREGLTPRPCDVPWTRRQEDQMSEATRRADSIGSSRADRPRAFEPGAGRGALRHPRAHGSPSSTTRPRRVCPATPTRTWSPCSRRSRWP